MRHLSGNPCVELRMVSALLLLLQHALLLLLPQLLLTLLLLLLVDHLLRVLLPDPLAATPFEAGAVAPAREDLPVPDHAKRLQLDRQQRPAPRRAASGARRDQ